MRFDDVKWLVGEKILNEKTLQFGQHVGKVPQFEDYGYDFKMDVLRNYVNENKYRHYLMKYGAYYESTDN